ncbi:MAG: hypothetical protein AB7O37_22715 [Vicinamibacteria bacterium]
MRLLSALALVLLALAALPAEAADTPAGGSPFASLEFRNVGPTNMGGRVSDVEGVPGDPKVVYVGAAAGGVWKTEDGGLTFRPVFDEQPVHSIGDIALAPSNPAVVYVGTGEANARNSISPGRGVYKSTDAGKSWTLVGLEETRHVSRVLVHPRDPDVVFVGALGHMFGPNPERGVFRSKDGGKSWAKVLYLDAEHGVADMDLSPVNPNLVFAAMWRFERKPWTHTSGSREGGVWRSVDGGDSWKKLENGLPKLLGRVAVKVAPSDPKIVYVMTESLEGTLYRSDDGGDSFHKVSDDRNIVSRGLYYTDLRVHPKNPESVFAVASLLQHSIDGGRTWKRISRSTHIDFHALWIDPLDPGRMWQGQDGGVAVSYDGVSWEPIRNLPLAQFYQVYADARVPFYFLGGGLQDNGAWYGPSRTREPAGILEDDWRMPSFGDAFYMAVHPDDPDLILSESQGGSLYRTDLRTRQQRAVSPQPRRNDGGPVGPLKYRFNWNSPVVASPHDGKHVYFAGNVVFRSKDFGLTWETLSPDLTTDDPEKQKEAGGPVWKENTTAEYHCTIISFAESAAKAGVLWAGTDDGNLQLSQDDGKTWTNVVANVKGLPAFSPVSHVEPSRSEPGSAWVAFDRHMFDDSAPHVFLTRDFGRTFTRVGAGLPSLGYVHVLRQDPKNPKLVYAGTDLGLYASWDEGRSFQALRGKNLPAAMPVHDVLIHPRENDLILGTHGRALWILDDATPLQQLDPAAPPASRLFDVRPGLRFPLRFTRYGVGDKAFKGANPPSGALIHYSLAESLEPPPAEAKGASPAAAGAKAAAPAKARLKLEILDSSGRLVRTLDKLGLAKGVNRAVWDLRHEAPKPRKDGPVEASEFGPPPSGPSALPGRYTARLTVDGKSHETPVEVRVDPLVPVSEAELRAQYELASALTPIRTEANLALRALDAVGAQMKERRATARSLGIVLGEEASAVFTAAERDWKAVLDGLAQPEGEPRWSQGPRVSEQLNGLFGAVDSAFAAPTAAQLAYFEELRGEARTALDRAARFLDESLPRLNQALAASGLPGIVRPAR